MTPQRWCLLAKAGIAVVCLGALGAGWLVFSRPEPLFLPEVRALAGGRPTLGASDAPVQLVLFSDFQCPHCRDFERVVLPVLQEEFFDRGLARLTFIHAPFLSENSLSASLAAACAFQQSNDAFWAFAAEVFRAQGSPLRAWASQERLLTLASRTKGLDAATFETCLSTHAGETAIARDKQLVEALGLRAVPALFVAGQQVTPTVRDLRAAVRNALQNVNLGRQE